MSQKVLVERPDGTLWKVTTDGQFGLDHFQKHNPRTKVAHDGYEPYRVYAEPEIATAEPNEVAALREELAELRALVTAKK